MTSPTHENSLVFSLKEISLSFLSGREENSVLKHLNWEVTRGENLVLIGPSGEGKTVLLKLLAGLIPPDAGSYSLFGEPFYQLGTGARALLSRRIGMAFQRSGLFDSMNVFENLDFPMRELLDFSEKMREERIGQVLKDVGLEGREALRLEEMSGGMQKRLGIARAIVLEPEVLLYDDPTAGLDPITSRSIVDLMLATKEKYSMTCVTVTSDLHVARALSVPGTRVGFLYKGKFLSCEKAQKFWRLENAHPVLRQFVSGDLTGPLTAEEISA